MEKFNRAVRRHHSARLKRNRAAYWGGFPKDSACSNPGRYLGLLLNSAALCSCWMCGNPRRHRRELSIGERSATQRKLYPDD